MKHVILVLSYFVGWTVIMMSSAYLCYKIPLSFFNPDSVLFKERSFEQGGRFYERVFLVKRWKHLLPDGASLFKGGFRKKHLAESSKEYFGEFILESCRAEATHIPPIFLSLLFWLYNPFNIVLIMIVFAIVVNLPCIIAQRYNRIRLAKIIQKQTLRRR